MVDLGNCLSFEFLHSPLGNILRGWQNCVELSQDNCQMLTAQTVTCPGKVRPTYYKPVIEFFFHCCFGIDVVWVCPQRFA
jgi:hypothetical protein